MCSRGQGRPRGLHLQEVKKIGFWGVHFGISGGGTPKLSQNICFLNINLE